MLEFGEAVAVGLSGEICVYDAADGRLVDRLDLSVPAGPTEPDRTPADYTPVPYDYARPVPYPTNANTRPGTPSGVAVPTPDSYQLTIIGGFTDGFHFRPVIARGRRATVQLHHNLLAYGKTYFVEMDAGVLSVAREPFAGFQGAEAWRFSTKATPPVAGADRYVVAADGSGDFNTVQGAMDFLPDFGGEPVTVEVKNGVYEEIVYFRNKAHVTLQGESRDGVVIRYGNNEVFNPHPVNVATNEWPGTFPSRRAAFAADNCTDLVLRDLTIESINPKPAQAEGLLLMGERNVVRNVSIIGSGDALQVNGSAYFEDVSIHGLGDNILGRGPAFFRGCELVSTSGPHMWIRNTAANHGNVFVDSVFRTEGDVETIIARAPTNHGRDYPYAEAVLIDCRVEGLRPEGWGPVGPDATQVRYLEFNTRNLADGQLADVTQRAPWSRQLDAEADAELIARYRDPAFVLGGWSPILVTP